MNDLNPSQQLEIQTAYQFHKSNPDLSMDQISEMTNAYLNPHSSKPSMMDNVKSHLQSIGAGLVQPSIDLASGIENKLEQGIHGVAPSLQVQPQLNTNLQLVNNAPDQQLANLAQIPGSFLTPGGEALKAMKTLKGTIGAGTALGGLYGLGYGNANNPNSSGLYNTALGAATGGALQGVLGGTGRYFQNKINKPLQTIQAQAEKEKGFGVLPTKRPLTPDEASQRLQTAHQVGIQPNLGTLTNDPKAIRDFEEAAFAPKNNQQAYAAQNIGRADQLGSNIYNDLNRGLDREEIAPTLTNEINDIFNAKKSQSKANYDNLADLADQSGIFGNRSSAQSYAAQQLLKHQNAQNMGKLSAIDGDTLDILKTVSKDITPTEETPYNFSDLKEERSIIGEKLNQLRESNPKATTAENILENLYKKYSDDMGNTLKNSGDNSLYDAWKNANDYHRDEVTPYYQGRLPYILKNETHEKITNELLNNSKHGDLISSLPNETKKLLLGSKIASTLPSDEFSANKFLSGYNKVSKTANIKPLTQGITHVINGREMPLKSALSKLSTVSEMNEPLQKIKDTLPTGYALKGAQHSGIPASLGALIGLGVHGPLGALGGAAIGTAYAGIKGRLTSNYLKNPEVLKAYANPEQRTEILKKTYPLLSRVPQYLPIGVQNYLNYLMQGGG